ncbi:hypothetical protein AYL99_00402 [Fonsecaea erecta]|uniref:CHAT domain-containing protein n=1 Tax=Fonsecaea erecta TaxID=1367422 RepID=A0A178ZX74_9EURO|nr:hypothetical protein AYL99_00402 [Fonsecaea erecta]OAP64430.1 hypothetical protein AYL99_00402 [Fonsecaea erecta]
MAALSTIDLNTLSYDALGDLNERFYYLFEDHGNIDDLRAALSLAPAIIERSEDGLQKAQWMNVLSQQYDALYIAAGSLASLEAAIRYARGAIEEFSEGSDGDLLELKLNLERLLWKQFSTQQTIQNLEEVISVSREVVELRSREDSGVDLAIDLHNLGLRLHTLYLDRGKTEDLQNAVAAQRRALSCSDLDPELVVVFKVELGKKLSALYGFTESLELIVETVELAEHLVKTADRLSENHADHLETLSVRLRTCASHTGCLLDYHDAILAAQRSIIGTAVGHPRLPMRLSNLSSALIARYEKLGSSVDLSAGLEAIEGAVQMLEEASPDAAVVNSTAADVFSYTFTQTGNIVHIEKAVAYREKSIAQTPPRRPALAGRLSNLSNDLLLLYTRRGLVSDINRATEAGFRGLSLASAQDSAQRFKIRSVLSNALITRFQRTGSLWDLQNGLNIAKTAFEQPPLKYLQPRLVNNLANILHLRYKRLGQLDDLTTAIDSMGMSLESKAGSLEDQLTIMANLASMLRIRALATIGSASNHDLLRAKLLGYFVADHTSKNHRDYPTRLNTLINVLHLLSQKSDNSRSIKYLQDAIRYAERAASCSPNDNPERATLLIGLANLYGTQSQKSADVAGSNKSLNCYLDAWKSLAAPPLKRINAATFAAEILCQQKDYGRASRLVQDALSLVPLASARSLAIGDQQHVLSQLSGLGSLGCSMALQAGQKPEEALQILEMGRGTILGNIIAASAPELGNNPDTAALYERYFSLLNSLDRQAVENEHISRTSSQFNITATVDEQYAVLQAIRGRPGHERFQMPPNPLEMQAAAAEGMIVVICSTELRADAIVVREGGFLVVPLPEVNFQDVVTRAKLIAEDLTSYTLRTLAAKSKQFAEQMHWLWCKFVAPTFRALGLETKTSVQELARIRWVAVGALGVFPFHAAGIHNPGSTDNTFAYAISSYVPTIRSLVHASKKVSPIIKSAGNRMLFVGMPETAQHRELIEVRTLQQQLGQLNYDVQFLKQNIPSKVLACLSQCDMLLCACHGIADRSNPSESYLALQALATQPDSPDQEASDPADAILDGINRDGRLTVRAISYQNRGQRSNKSMPRLAFLMACSTATIKSLELSDETLHLASAFHLAGCQHVVGTMWKAIQRASIDVALHFYASIGRPVEVPRREVSDAWHIAAALHEATLSVREENPALILKWAPFIHIGP